MTKTIGIIGSGMIGSNVARLATAAGLNVVICNSRGPETLAELVAELGANARAGTLADVVAASNLLILAVPFAIYAALPVDLLAGKTIVDTLNYYPQRDGVMSEVDTMNIATTELLQKHLTKSVVIRAINNVDFVRLLTSARPAGSLERSALPVAGDDAKAKTEVIDFLNDIGYDAVDMGALAESWRSEPTMPVYVAPYMTPETTYVGQRVNVKTFMSAPGRVVSKDEVQQLVNKAVRHDSMVGLLPEFAD